MRCENRNLAKHVVHQANTRAIQAKKGARVTLKTYKKTYIPYIPSLPSSMQKESCVLTCQRNLEHSNIHLVYPPCSKCHHQDHYIFRFGNSNLNLYLPLESWEGGSSKIYTSCAAHHHLVTTCQHCSHAHGHHSSTCCPCFSNAKHCWIVAGCRRQKQRTNKCEPGSTVKPSWRLPSLKEWLLWLWYVMWLWSICIHPRHSSASSIQSKLQPAWCHPPHRLYAWLLSLGLAVLPM